MSLLNELLPLLKGLGIVAFIMWFAKLLRDNGRKDEKLKYVESKNQKLLHQQEYQVLEIKRSEEQAKNAKEYADKVERKLSEIDPTVLDSLTLDRVSQDPLVDFEDFYRRSGESTKSPKDEND